MWGCSTDTTSQLPLPLYLPLIIELLHGPAHLAHDIIRPALAADAQVPLSTADTQVLGLLGIEFIQSMTRSRWLSFSHQEWHSLRVRLGKVVSGQIIKEGVRGTCGQVEVFGFTHNAPVIYDQMVGNCKRVLVFPTIEKTTVKIDRWTRTVT